MAKKQTKKTDTKVQETDIPHEETVAQTIKGWQEYWPKLQEAALDSEEHFDKKIFTLSAGAIGIVLTLLQFLDVTPCSVIWVIIAASLCVIALLMNLLVQYIAKYQQDNQAELIRTFIANPIDDDSYISERMRKDNKILMWINGISIGCLISGIICLCVFTVINLV